MSFCALLQWRNTLQLRYNGCHGSIYAKKAAIGIFQTSSGIADRSEPQAHILKPGKMDSLDHNILKIHPSLQINDETAEAFLHRKCFILMWSLHCVIKLRMLKTIETLFSSETLCPTSLFNTKRHPWSHYFTSTEHAAPMHEEVCPLCYKDKKGNLNHIIGSMHWHWTEDRVCFSCSLFEE